MTAKVKKNAPSLTLPFKGGGSERNHALSKMNTDLIAWMPYDRSYPSPILRAGHEDPWRSRRDSNPRYAFRAYNGLANRRLQPLGHSS